MYGDNFHSNSGSFPLLVMVLANALIRFVRCTADALGPLQHNGVHPKGSTDMTKGGEKLVECLLLINFDCQMG